MHLHSVLYHQIYIQGWQFVTVVIYFEVGGFIIPSDGYFLFQTLCVFLQIKYTKHIKWDFCSDALVEFGAAGCQGGRNCIYFEHVHVAYQIDGDD